MSIANEIRGDFLFNALKKKDLLSVCIATVESVDFKNVSAGFGYKCSNILSTVKTVKMRLLHCFRRRIRAEFFPHISLHPAVGATVTHI